MRQKLIVKTNWLSFLPASKAATTTLQALILAGKIQIEKNIPKDLLAKLGPEEVSYILEKTHQVLGRPSYLVKSLESLSAKAPARSSELWQERAFLKGFALSRLGRASESDQWFTLLPENFSPRIQTEKALILLNQGEFIGAASLFKRALNSDVELDPYSLCTLLGGLSLSLIQQGSFREAEQALKQRRYILKTNLSPSLEFGTRLYEILLLLERNEFDEANELLRGSIDEYSADSINGFFLRHLKLRLLLARNELAEAQAILANFRDLLDAQKLPQGVLDFRIEEIEWNLRSQKPDEALEGITRLEAEAPAKQDHYLQFRLSLLKAQAVYLRSDAEKAYQEIAAIIQQGEKRHYLPGLTWALFHGAGISLAAGYPVQAKLYLHRGERLATELGLRVRSASFSYIAEVMEQQQTNGHALLSLVRRQEIGPEMEYYLDSYSLLADVALTVSSRRGQELVAEADLRRRLFREAGLFWFQKEEILLANFGDRKMRFVDLSQKPNLLSAFRLFWNAYQNLDNGFTLNEVHQTRMPSTYREELHAGATKMLISRLREAIHHCGLKIAYNRDDGRYSLQSQLSPFTLLSRAETPQTRPEKRSREDELLSRIAMEPFVSTRVLCHEFKVSRQALHPFLSKLVDKKMIRMVKRGPVSGYIFLAKK